jgi:hypothetical protein
MHILLAHPLIFFVEAVYRLDRHHNPESSLDPDSSNIHINSPVGFEEWYGSIVSVARALRNPR